MGKKKAFIERKEAQRFRLVPGGRGKSDTFVPTEDDLEEQHKYGVYFDDDYDYMQHLRSVNEGMTMEEVNKEPVQEEKTVIKMPSEFPPPPFMFENAGNKTEEFFDEDIDRALEGDLDMDDIEGGDFEDDFINLAGGVVDERTTTYRGKGHGSDFDDDDDDEEGPYSDIDDDDYLEEDERHSNDLKHNEEQRDIDEAFEQLMDREYHDDQIGELDGDDDRVGGCLEPNDGYLKKLTSEKRHNPEYDEQLAKDYVRQRMRLIEEGVINDKEEMTEIEVDESTRKRAKWDCDSFATQYTNIYNHPTLIREQRSGLSRKGLRLLDNAVEEMDTVEEDEDMEDDDDDASQCTGVSTFRPKGETPEQRKLRKQAVKESRRARRQEKKANKVAFSEESRKIAKGRLGQIKAKPV